MSRSNPMPWLAGGSLVALGVLVALLYLESRPSGGVEAGPMSDKETRQRRNGAAAAPIDCSQRTKLYH